MKIRLVADSPVFSTVQGEGLLTGAPSTFVRLAGCDLRCAVKGGKGWSCDTPKSLPDYNHKLNVWRPVTKFADEHDVHDVVERVMRLGNRNVVVTGGEPMLQADAVHSFVSALSDMARVLEKPTPHVTLETNGRRFDTILSWWVRLISMSPKVYQADAVDLPVIRKWCKPRHLTVQVKVVLAELHKPALDMAVKVFQTVRDMRSDAALYVQRADRPDNKSNTAEVLDWVMTAPELRSLDVRYGLQAHKVIGVP